MPLPEKSYEYLDAALLSLKEGGGCVHYYDFIHARKGENPVGKTWGKVEDVLSRLKPNHKLILGRVVRSVGPNWYQVVLDVSVGAVLP